MLTVTRYDIRAVAAELGEPPWQLACHNPAHCSCAWCSRLRVHSYAVEVPDTEPEEVFATALADQTIRALESGQSVRRVVAEVQKIFRGRR
jgi:hypothetical protein